MLLLSAALLLVGCGSTRNKDESGPSDEVEDPTVQANFGAMRQSPEYAVATAKFQDCLLAEGYDVKDPAGTLLRDGSRFKADVGTGYTIEGAVLEFFMAREACSDSSGLTALTAAFGLAQPTIPPARLQQLNDTLVKQMQCMERTGWTIPEPVKLRDGLLIYDFGLTGEDKAAYTADFTECNVELFGNPTGPVRP